MEHYVAAASQPAKLELSRVVFGQERRLALCLFVGRHQTGHFTQAEAAKALGVGASVIQRPLQHLINAGFVVRRSEPAAEDTRTSPLARCESLLWKLADELLDDSPELQPELPFT